MDSSRLIEHSYQSDDEYSLDQAPSSRKRAHFLPLPGRATSGHYRPLTTHDNHQAFSDDDSEDLEAPASLMVEQPSESHQQLPSVPSQSHSTPLQQQHRPQPQPQQPPQSTSRRERMSTYDRTMWRWTNVENMDDFFQRVYAYYQDKGIYCILLSRFLNLLTLAFVIFFSTFLIGCVDYAEIPNHHALSDVITPQCFSRLSPTTAMFFTMFMLWWGWQAIRFFLDLPALREMHNFYHHLLGIPDQDMQTVSWQTVLDRITDIRETNPNTAQASPLRLDAMTVANRIMRQENYLIALFNKDILNITIPLPYLRNKHIFTRDLEWNLSYCVLSYVFNSQGQIRKRFLQERNRPLLVAGLRRRFFFMGLLNFIFAPFILVYLIIFFFFRYFEEYHKNPSEIGSRTYSPFAKWKFREFNELPHLFHMRLSKSYLPANEYINQFPKEKTAIVARFVSFITGSFAGVLAILTLFDSEALLNFEITSNGTVLFYLGVFGTAFAVSRGMIPDEHLVFQPEVLLRQVVEHTHYFPSEWRGKLHTDEVRGLFCQLFDYKISLFFQELLSVVFTPLVLWFSLPNSANQIVDFFREFTVHVDGLGYVCSFAQFDFARHGNVKYGAPVQVEDEYYVTKEGKMEKSFLNFKANHPDWEPTDVGGSMYLARLHDLRHQRLDDAIEEEEDSMDHRPRRRSPSPPSTRLTPYGVPENIHVPSDLGDSFAGAPKAYAWPVQEDNQDQQSSPAMLGLLNGMYDLSNRPRV